MPAPATVRTTTPDPPAPPLRCPQCHEALTYRETFIGGVRADERWDVLACGVHGLYEYRHRTRRVRPLAVSR